MYEKVERYWIRSRPVIFGHDGIVGKTAEGYHGGCFLSVPSNSYVYGTTTLDEVCHEIQERNL